MKLAIHGGQPVRTVPFPSRSPYGPDDIKEVSEALLSQNLFYTSGNKIAAFEKEFASKYGIKYALTCSSGTAAIHMAVAALNLDPGSEVITVPVTDFGTIAGMLFQGLIPVFADWKKDTFCVDPDSIEKNITERTRAIVVVHLFGNPCDMDAVMRLARKHHLPVIEDCCQAYFTLYKGQLAGTIGDIGCFSMQQTKHLPTGEGGAVITNHDDYAMRMSLFRDKGWENRAKWGSRSYTFLGMNYRMNELTGAVALAQLRKTESAVAAMRRLGNQLTGLIDSIPGIFPCPVTPGGEHSYWEYALRILDGDPQYFVKCLQAEGIPCGWGYTVNPIYLCTEALTKKRTFGNSSYPFDSPYYPGRIEYQPGLCPVAERELKQICLIRIYENWAENDIVDIAAAIRKVAAGLKEGQLS